MVPQGPPAPHGGGQPVPPALLRSNSAMLGGQGGGMPSQNVFSSLVSPRNQFNNMNMLGNVPNVSSLLHQPFGNGASNSGPASSQRGLIDGGAEADPLSNVGTRMGFNHPSSSYMSSPVTANPNSSGQQQQFSNTSGNQMMPHQQQAQQLDPQNFQHNQQQFSVPSNTQQSQQQFQAMRGGLGGVGPVKVEPQGTNEQAPQQLQGLRNLGPVKLEPQQLQSMRSLDPVKMEPQHSDSSLFLHQQQQQQQQQQLLLSRQSSQAAAAAQILHQQRLMQIQHQQQQQLLKSMPQQRSPMQQQFQQQNLPVRSPMKPVYEPGMCARRLTHYMYQQQHRPEDNNIEFWRKFVAEFFAPNAKKKWCVSMYGSGRQTTGVFPQDVWHCEICNRKPGRGFGALPSMICYVIFVNFLLQLLRRASLSNFGVVRDGQLRIVFSPDLKICSWEFCARRHEELIPRRLLIPQVSQVGAAAQKCQAATQNASSSISVSELQNNCNMFVASARQLAKALEVPLVNDLGYTKRYVRCLQLLFVNSEGLSNLCTAHAQKRKLSIKQEIFYEISEVVNSMKDLIDYSRETGTGPMESLIKFPQRANPSPRFQNQSQQGEGQLQQQQQTMGQNSNNDNPAQAAASKGTPNANNTTNSVPTTSSNNTIVGLLHQNSMNSRQQNAISSANSPMPQTQPSPARFQSPTPSSSNNPQPNSLSPNISMQQPSISSDAEANDSQSSVQKIIHDMMMSSQIGGNVMMGMGTMNTDMKNVNGVLSANNNNAGVNGSNILVGNGLGQSAMVNGIRAALGNNNNSMSMNGRVGMAMGREQSMSQQDLGNQLLSGLGAVNGFNDLQFDWKGSP
ncbi:hypothetical protein DH2020_034754 [Rehmannia glutinosa]|uniref:Transcriptional corepressor SEUSS-like protein n=1 Tax=Rehmannia glutinosa TaxID=99300 RepID=A0ABR0VAP2_REHGL